MLPSLKPIMFVGTCSDAGKSIVNAAFCRIFKQDGYSPAPFKAQNMSLNSYSTPEGGEMGRAQVVQAEACGIMPHTDMNPVLLKPNSNKTSQVILNGRPVGNYSAKDYFNKSLYKNELFEEAKKAFQRLSTKYNPIVLEGAGSISELNLRDRDITNMRMAIASGASTYLVADIDRGGLFGSVYGTIMLLRPEERERIKGIIINKFRGDTTLFEDGKKMLEDLTSVPVTGIIPWFDDIIIEEEDSVALKNKANTLSTNQINIAVIRHNQLSNYTDFDNLARNPKLNLFYTYSPEDVEKADIIILPGSKSTLSDLQHLWDSGMADSIMKAYENGKKVIGICGGYQMMGTQISDPDGIEGCVSEYKGLGLLPQYTVMEKDKVTVQCEFAFLPKEDNHSKYLNLGYEIHQGRTIINEGNETAPLALLSDGRMDGHYRNNRCWGTYIHGILDNAEIVEDLLKDLLPLSSYKYMDYNAFKNSQYDKLADFVRAHVDMKAIYESLKL